MIVKYFFHIIDKQFNDEYDYNGYFKDHFEADRFIVENEEEGNTVYVVSPYYEYLPEDSVDLNAIHDPERA